MLVRTVLERTARPAICSPMCERRLSPRDDRQLAVDLLNLLTQPRNSLRREIRPVDGVPRPDDQRAVGRQQLAGER